MFQRMELREFNRNRRRHLPGCAKAEAPRTCVSQKLGRHTGYSRAYRAVKSRISKKKLERRPLHRNCCGTFRLGNLHVPGASHGASSRQSRRTSLLPLRGPRQFIRAKTHNRGLLFSSALLCSRPGRAKTNNGRTFTTLFHVFTRHHVHSRPCAQRNPRCNRCLAYWQGCS